MQLQGEYMYFRDRQEGQADIGLVNRFASRAQAGLFASFKHVNFTGRNPGNNIFTDSPVTQFDVGEMTGNGLLGQASLTLDYLFSRGKRRHFRIQGLPAGCCTQPGCYGKPQRIHRILPAARSIRLVLAQRSA